MEEVEIKRIADYIEGLEEDLDEWDYQGTTTQRHLTKLHLTIEWLMDTIFKTEDQQLRALLATLESKARRCKQCIERRLMSVSMVRTIPGRVEQ
jgi:hypothetical protein